MPKPKFSLTTATPLLAGALLLLAAPAFSDDVASLARRLSGLRSEVETLSAKLGQINSDAREELRSLSRQKTDLELEVKKEQTRIAKIRLAVSQKRKAIEADKSQDAELRPVFQSSLGKVRAHVQRSLPFRTEERLAELDKLDEQFQAGLLSPPKAVSRLWTFMEDEVRLTKESGLYRQTISIDGSEQLADVVRIGMVMMFFKTGTGEVGYAAHDNDAWRFVSLADPKDRALVTNLFDTFKKQIRQGYFELPNALSDLAPPKPLPPMPKIEAPVASASAAPAEPKKEPGAPKPATQPTEKEGGE